MSHLIYDGCISTVQNSPVTNLYTKKNLQYTFCRKFWFGTHEKRCKIWSIINNSAEYFPNVLKFGNLLQYETLTLGIRTKTPPVKTKMADSVKVSCFWVLTHSHFCCYRFDYNFEINAKKLLSLNTVYGRHKSRLWNSKNHCVLSHAMENSRCALTKRAVVHLIVLVTFIICKVNTTMYNVWLIIVDYTTVIMLVAHLKWGKGNDL